MDVRKWFCLTLACFSLTAQARSPMWEEIKLYRVELGVINGFVTAARAGDIVSPTGATIDGDNTLRSYELGLQTKLFLGPFNELRGFIYANAVGIVDYTHHIINEPFVTSSVDSTANLKSNYVARVGVGLETDPFLFFTGSIGAGLAVFNQKLETTINDFSTLKSSRNRTSVAPTVLLGLNYHYCNNCIAQHPLILSFEFNTEQNPTVSNNTPSVFGTYRTTLRSAWVYHWDFIVSTGF